MWRGGTVGSRGAILPSRLHGNDMLRHEPTAHSPTLLAAYVPEAWMVEHSATRAPGVGSPLPHLHRDWARPCHICAGIGLAPATSALG